MYLSQKTFNRFIIMLPVACVFIFTLAVLFDCLTPTVATLPLPLLGQAQVLDGDTIVIKGSHLRLSGIDAPEKKQQCKTPAGRDYFCGLIAKKQLEVLLEEKDVACDLLKKDRYNRWVATCFVEDGDEEININQFMVHNGFAFAYRTYSKQYVLDEDYAKKKSLGVWQGTFQYPWEWRKARRKH